MTTTTEVGEKRAWWQVAIALGFWLLVISAIAFGTWKGYASLQKQRTLRKAQMFFDARDYASAEAWVQRALRWNPRSVEALRISAKAREAENSPTALALWKRVTELDPTAENYLALGRAALRFHQPELAEQAVMRIDEKGKGSASSYELHASLAEAAGDLKQAEANLAQALKIDPQNQRCRLRLAAIRLQSDDPHIKDGARVIVEEFIGHPELRRIASQSLLRDALTRGRAVSAITLARALAAGPESTFDDRIEYLRILRQFRHASFSRQLLRLQDESTGDPKRAATLISWMNANGLTLLASDWAKRLPPETRSSGAVPAAIADSYAAMGDWDSVKKLVFEGNWGAFEFSRLMLFARVSRMQGDERGWNERWTAAVKEARGRPEVLAVLANNAAAWGWENEAVEVLWSAANRSTNQRWALEALQQKYSANENTRGLLRVTVRRHEIDPKDRLAQNTLARLNLLLNSDMKQALVLAEACYKAEPENALYASTYGFALHLQGKTEDGLKIIRRLENKQLERPEVAAYYGVMLAETGATEEARKYLNLADLGNLLPEETALVAQTRKALAGSSQNAVTH